MDWTQTLVIILIGIAAGFLGGVVGIGGAIIIIPALVMLVGFSQQLAQGATILMMVFPVGALASWQYCKVGNADVRTALIPTAGFFVSSFIGAKFANLISQDMLKRGFAVLLILVAVRMLFFEKALK